MSSSPEDLAHEYKVDNLVNLAFPRVMLASLKLPELSSEVRTWGELRSYIRANSSNLPKNTHEVLEKLEIKYAEDRLAVPLVPPASSTQNVATSTPATKARGKGKRGSGRAKGKAGRQGNVRGRGGGSPKSVKPSKPTPVAQQSEGLSQVTLPSRRTLQTPPFYGSSSWGESQKPKSSRAHPALTPSQQPLRTWGKNPVSPPRRGTVVLTVVPGGKKVLRSFENTPNIGPSAMVRTAPRAQSISTISKDNPRSSNSTQAVKSNITIPDARDTNIAASIIDSKIPTNISEALCVFPSLSPSRRHDNTLFARKTASSGRRTNVAASIIDSKIPTNVSEALCVFPSLIPEPAP